MRRPLLLAALAALLVLAGCGDDDVETGDVGTDGSSATEPADTTEPEDTPEETVSVAEAVELDEGTAVTVRGYVFQPDEGATVMCDVLGESFPPICVGPTIPTDGLDINSLSGVETTAPGDLVAPATWTSAPVEVSGTVESGRLVVDT